MSGQQGGGEWLPAELDVYLLISATHTTGHPLENGTLLSKVLETLLFSSLNGLSHYFDTTIK